VPALWTEREKGQVGGIWRGCSWSARHPPTCRSRPRQPPAARAATRAHDSAERNKSAERCVSRAKQRRDSGWRPDWAEGGEAGERTGSKRTGCPDRRCGRGFSGAAATQLASACERALCCYLGGRADAPPGPHRRETKPSEGNCWEPSARVQQLRSPGTVVGARCARATTRTCGCLAAKGEAGPARWPEFGDSLVTAALRSGWGCGGGRGGGGRRGGVGRNMSESRRIRQPL
jgi:hypothetical protein